MKSTGVFTQSLMLTLAPLICTMCTTTVAEDRVIREQCAAPYSDGYVSKPCTLCSVCIKVWDPTKRTTTDQCSKSTYFHTYAGAMSTVTPFIIAYVGGRDICSMKQTCHPNTGFKCVNSRQFPKWEDERVALLTDCKCRCDATHYGQTCNHTVPSHLSVDSFADVQNIVYVPIVYATDYATVHVYFYTTGTNLNVRVRTETQSLRYDSASCRTDVPRLEDLCGTLFEDGGVHDYRKFCRGGPTFDEHAENTVCAVTINIAFPKDKLTELNKKMFVSDEDGSKTKSDANIAAKIERVEIAVSNGIPDLDESEARVVYTFFGITVIYKGKSPFEDCPIRITIPQYAKSSDSAPSFPRSQEISLTNLVVLDRVAACEHLGDPVTGWLVWLLQVNHDERDDPPFHELFETPTLTFAPFTLPYGKFKVKTTVRFIDRSFDKAFAYCYFQIIPIPLQPLSIGGTLRYIYYKSNLDLVSDVLVDPNYPANAQPKLKRIWYCDDTADKVCERTTGEEMVVTKYGPFEPGKSYYFTMSVKSPSLPLESCHQTIIISQDPMPSLLIECLRNCGGEGFKSDTRELFYFRVWNSDQRSDEVRVNDVYNWTYAMGDAAFTDVHDVRQEEETPSWILIVSDNSLQNSQEYTFKVSGGGENKGEAQLKVKMFKYTDTFHCAISPKLGTAGQTKFSIQCNKAQFEQNQHLSLNVYFYDKFNASDEFGRLLGSNHMELIEDIVLTRGTVTVSATNMFGEFQTTHVQVSLTFPSLTAEFLNQSMVTLQRLSENEGYNQKLSFISSLCDVLNKEPSTKERYLETFLEVIDEEDAIDLVHLEVLLSATQSVLCIEKNCTNTKMSVRAYQLLADILTDVSNKLAKELQRTAKGHSELPTSKVNFLYTALLKCSGVFLSVQNTDLTNNDSMTVDYNLYSLYKVGNLRILKSLEKVNRALAIKNMRFIKHNAIRTEFVDTWMKEDVTVYFTKGTKGNYSGSYLVITHALAESLRNVSYHIVVHVMSFKNNPYWWSQTEQVSTRVVSVAIGYTIDYRSYTPITHFSRFIDIFLRKNKNLNVTVSGNVTQPDPVNDELNDLAVNVHQIYVLKGEKISLKFVDLEVEDVFRVSVLKNHRPDYDLVVNGAIVNYSSPWYRSQTSITVTKDDDVVFVGILPGNSVPVNKTKRYRFELQSARCQIWHDFLWDASGCSLGPNSSEEFLHCQCTHLSSVAGFIGVPMNTINPLEDYTLFLTIPENPFVFVFVLVILLVYMLLLIWAYAGNKRDVLTTSLIILEDNISGDNFGYLLIVFTGSRLYAGTTSHIGIILHGSQTSSRSHILKCSRRPTLSRDSDDWFLLYAPKSLGIISSVQIWSDHSGASPNWFCDRIHVHDFESDRDYSFLIGKWFGVTQKETRMESYARPIELEKENHVIEFFLTNLVSGFRESHIWISILARHPRSPMTRAQRLSLAMVALVTTLLGCILFYDAAMPEDEDALRYSVSTREALISGYTLCISVGVTGVVFFAFSKSYKYEQPVGSVQQVQDKRQSSRIAETRVRVDSAATLRQRKEAVRGFKYYIKKAIISLRQDHFYPVQVRTDQQSKELITVHKTRLVLSWILCAFIIFICCTFTVWVGLKIGKNKSLLWLTSIGMTLVEDTFISDPLKILVIALLFGLVQTQLCDLYAYDPRIYDVRKSLTLQLDRDQRIHQTRLKELYKPATIERLEDVLDQQRLVQKWWALIDILDIVFLVFVIFCIIQRTEHHGYFYTSSVFTNMAFNKIQVDKNFAPSPAVNNVSRYSMYLQDSVFSNIYCTQWYNKRPLTGQNESYAETGWTKTYTHRMIGIPRLRQIRVHREACRLPSLLTNLSVYCNVPYLRRTEDTEYYSAQWKNYTSEYVDVVFDKSPWLYTYPDEVSSLGVASMYSESGELFHGAGYIAQLTRTRRASVGTLLNLVDLDWLDMRTRIIFFEMTAYNVNNNVFTAIIFAAEHLESGLVLANEYVRSIDVERENVLLEVVYFFYSVLVLIKLLMILNTVGPQEFFTSFWTLYDLCFVLIGLVYFIGYRIVLEMYSDLINQFQRSEQEDFFPFAGLFFTKTLDTYITSLLFIFATARTLRLFKYVTSVIHIKHRYTLYFAWPQILCVTSVLLLFMFSYQRLLEYLLNCLYPLGTSHWLQHKMSYRDLQVATTVNPDTVFFVYIPCCLSGLGLVFYKLVIIEGYSRANAMKILQDKEF